MQVLDIATVRSFCRVSNADDTLLTLLANSVEQWVERELGIAFGEQTLTETVDGGGYALSLSRGPVLAVNSVYDEYADETVDTDDYELRDGTVYGDGGRWADDVPRQFRVEYVAGYAVTETGTTTTAADAWTPETVPDGLKLAMLHMVFRAYMARGGASSESASGWSGSWGEFDRGDIMAALAPYRRRGV
jgi:hypothetical protein